MCVKCNISISVAAEQQLSSSIISVPILCIVHLQYQPRLGVLFYFLSHLGSIQPGWACYSISYHALAVSAKAGHAILYLITPRQYPLTLGMLFFILSCLGSILQGWACYSISYHALTVSAEAGNANLYPVTPWQYLPWLGMLFYIL